MSSPRLSVRALVAALCAGPCAALLIARSDGSTGAAGADVCAMSPFDIKKQTCVP